MHLVLFEPDIPQNTGSLIRLAACVGVALHVVEPCGFPFDDRRLKRVSLDYFDLANITRHTSWETFLQTHGRQRLILLTTKAELPYTQFAFQKDDMLIVGRESSGVPQAVAARADARVKIPMHNGARSLNVALAAGMVLGEALRQTGAP